MTEALLLHGSFGNPYENWFGSVADALAKVDVPAYVPHFPSPIKQDFDTWSRIVDVYVDSGIVGPNPILIGHSSGAVFGAKYVVERDMALSQYVAVAGFNNFWSGNAVFDQINEGFFLPDEALTSIQKLASHRIAFWGDDDPNLPEDVLASFASVVRAESFCVPGGGHLNSTAGYVTFDQLVQTVIAHL